MFQKTELSLACLQFPLRKKNVYLNQVLDINLVTTKKNQVLNYFSFYLKSFINSLMIIRERGDCGFFQSRFKIFSKKSTDASYS